MIKENQRLLNWLLKLADVSIAILVMPVAYYIRFDLLFGRPGIGCSTTSSTSTTRSATSRC